MAEVKIITSTDIAEFWPITSNIDSDKINAAILRAQQTDLEPILGSYLYYEFIEDYDTVNTFNTPIYQSLFDGGSYTYNNQTIYYRGVRQLLAVYSWIRLTQIIRINVVRSGQVVKIVEESDPLEDFQARADTRKALDEAVRLEKHTLQFLFTNRSDYPLYNIKPDTYQDSKTAFNFTRV